MNVYDFDKTLYNGESTIDFLKYYAVRNDWIGLVRLFPTILSATLRYRFGHLSNEEALSSYCEASEKYFSTPRNIDKLVKPFWDKNEKKIKSFYKDLHKEDDVVITLSPQFFIEEICSRLDIKHCLGTQMNPDTGKISFVCFKESKVKAFKEAFPDTEIENFYTDSMHDAPLMEIAKNVYMVKKNKITKIK